MHFQFLPSSLLLLALGGLSQTAAWSQPVIDTAEPAPWALHGQTTFISQAKPAFSAAYSGDNSLRPQEERSHSLTLTLDLGLRLWQGAQLHVNPELGHGNPFSHLTGGGGLSNGELTRVSGEQFTGYRARAFLLQRWAVGGDTETLDADFNELGGRAGAKRWTLVLGTFSLLDYFDPNPYAKDPRSQFFNWSFMTHGAWDYAADARGYTDAVLLEYRTPRWAVRAARGAQPRESNGLPLDPALDRRYGDQIEIEADLPWRLPAGPLHASLLGYRNQAVMGSFADALAAAQTQGGSPELANVRREQRKTGWGLTLTAPLGEDSGLFLRSSRNDGATETYAFTEIDEQLSIGGQFSATRWGRGQDRWGLGWSRNALSSTHRAYLEAGGKGAFLGDGALNYAPEQVLETWYRWALPEWGTRAGKVSSAFTLGWQFIQNPGYNQDRGPVQVYSLRWHSAF